MKPRINVHRPHGGAARPRTQSPASLPGWGAFVIAGLVVACLAAGAGTPHPEPRPEGRRGPAPDSIVTARVRPGLEVLLADSLHLVHARRVGLIANHTSVDLAGRHAIDRLRAADVRLVALFSPEHGIRGRAAPGEPVADTIEPRTQLPIHSLYGATHKPDPELLAGLDVLLFDLQDVGARYYTYAWTMVLAMQAAGEAGIPFVVLDRANPIGGRLVQGNVLESDHASFVGLHPVPMRHGMTLGEIARLVQRSGRADVELHVVPLDGWRRTMWFDETGLTWAPPSPNMPSIESATHYPGTCLFEGTNLSVGRGTEHPFQQIGAPWLDDVALAERLRTYHLPGVRFEPVRFTPVEPDDGKHPGIELGGVRFVVTDREVYDPTVAAVAALVEARRLSGERWIWRTEHFDRLAGTSQLRNAIEDSRPLADIVARWSDQRAAFAKARRAALLYPPTGSD